MSENKYFDSDNFENTDNSVEYEDMQSFEETYERSAEEPSEHTFEENRTDPFEGALERDFADPAQAVEESSYEWNSGSNYRNGEYHQSYMNNTNSNTFHNPNNYNDSFSTVGGGNAPGGYQEIQNPYGSYESADDSTRVYNYGEEERRKKKRDLKPSKPASRGFVAAALAVAIIASAGAGFGGGYFLSRQNVPASSNGMTIQQVTGGTNVGSSEVTPVSTSDIVKKTANSVVEIATEGTKTGTFARQYVTKGAGSGVIISEDGYIVTNHHVIEGANKITVTLRDGTTSYDAKVIGTDEDNDIALLKIDASGLTAAVFGNSSNLVVGDYVVAIGNPLGTLGGTVTDGIISALAREVTIENKNLTLLQTNAQISPGNSGGGLFNANGELVGIVNAKDSATEVEGIAFAIPVNKVVDIIKDLKDYGYVTGKIDTGMRFVDINSYDAAFYYNVNALGVYVLSVNQGSKAEAAGFKVGDMITEVNGTSVSSEAEIEKALEGKKVGDTVTFTVLRNNKSVNINLELSEYVPSVKPNDESAQQDFHSDESVWDQLINW